jgi:hypothetical protein
LYFRLSAGIRVLCHRDLARFFSATILYFNWNIYVYIYWWRVLGTIRSRFFGCLL